MGVYLINIEYIILILRVMLVILCFLWLILQELNLGRDKVSSFLQISFSFPF